MGYHTLTIPIVSVWDMFRLFLSHLHVLQTTNPRLTMFKVHSGIQNTYNTYCNGLGHVSTLSEASSCPIDDRSKVNNV